MANTLTGEQAALALARAKSDRRMVRYWLYFICIMVFAMVIVGGATRLTDSGLSITEWKPIHGIVPPLSAEDWNEEFLKYQQIPEYEQVNAGMTLEEFRFIFWWEWFHRFLGRMIGFVFFLPMLGFWVAGKLEPQLKPKLVGLFLLGGLQGAVGWWMVTSGLVDRVDVSQYRLAVHLTIAAFIFAWAMWIARGLAPHSTGKGPSNMLAWGWITLVAVFLQIFMGGLVAGLDAGMAYNEWPKMDGDWVPGGLNHLSPFWLNWFENAKSVQFNHRIMANVVLFLAVVNLMVAFGGSTQHTHRNRTVVLLLLVLLQAIIGIMTLLLQVPLIWALLHQGGAMVVLGFLVAHLRGLKGEYAIKLR